MSDDSHVCIVCVDRAPFVNATAARSHVRYTHGKLLHQIDSEQPELLIRPYGLVEAAAGDLLKFKSDVALLRGGDDFDDAVFDARGRAGLQ